MTYKDRTFCSYDRCSKWLDCDRAFKKKERIEHDLYDPDSIVAFYADEPECFDDGPSIQKGGLRGD